MKAKKTKKPRKENRLCKVGMEVQTVIFDTVIWNKKDAKKWLIDHGFKKTRGILEGNHYRYRQTPVTRFRKDSFRTKSIPKKGVKLIVACPKKEKKNYARSVNPSTKIPKVLVDIGKAIEIAFDSKIMTFRGCVLAANVEGTRLFVIKKKGKKTAHPTECSTVQKGRKLYSKFTDYESEKSYRIQIGSEKLELIGKAVHIVYQSDKWTGRLVEYIHVFRSPPSIYANSSHTIIALTGKIRVKREGITG